MAHPDMDITLDDMHFRLKGPLSYTNLATLPPKVVIGDYSNDTNELMSAWVLTDLSGGHGVHDIGPADTNRYRFADGIYARYPNQWSMPFRTRMTNEDDGLFHPLCDGLTKTSTDGNFEWRHFSLRGRTIYVDNVDTGREASTRASNKGVVFQGNGADPCLFIPRGSFGYTIYDPLANTVYNFTAPTFSAFALLDDKLIGIDTNGEIYKSVRSSDTLDADMTSGQTFFKVDAPDVKYSKDVIVQIDNEKMTVTGINKADQKVTVTRASSGTSAASHTKPAKIFGVWFKYGGKCRMPRGTDIRDLIVYLDRDSQPCVHIITDRDVWALDDGGPRVFPTALTFPQSPYSGVGAAVWRGDLYVAGGMDLYRYNGDSISNIGLSRDDGLPRNYQGFITDVAAGPNGLYVLCKGRSINNNGATAGNDYWSVHEWSGSGWHVIATGDGTWGSTTLSSTINSTTDEITVGNNNKFEYGDIIKIDSERLFVTDRLTSNRLRVKRGRYRTSAAGHTGGATVWITRPPTFIQVSLAEPDTIRVYWGIGRSRFYQEQPSEATNPREDVENDSFVGFGRVNVAVDGTVTYPSGTVYYLDSGRFDANMPGYMKIANGLEVRLRRLPASQILRVKYKIDNDSDWRLLGTVAGGDQTTLNGTINSSTTSVTLTNVEFIEPLMYLKIDDEVMRVTAVNTTTKVVTVVRSVLSTSAASHTGGATVYVDFRIGTVQNGRNLFRFGTYADNNDVFSGTPFHMLEFRFEVTDQRGNVTKNAVLASQLASGVINASGSNAEDDDLVTSLSAFPVTINDTFVIEHASFSYLKLRAPSGAWVAEVDLSQPWMDQSPEAMADKLDALLTEQRFVAFKHRDKLYRVRLSQVAGSDNPGEDERMTRRINIVEMPVTLGPLGDW